MTVFQHASVVPTSEIAGRELKGAYLKEGGGGPGMPVTPPL